MSTAPNAPTADRKGFDAIWMGLLVLLVLLPIPFGANRPWAWSAMALWAALLLGAWAVSLALGRVALVWRKTLIAPLVAGALVLAWILVTMLPWAGMANPIWQLASEALGRPLQGRITLSVDATLVALMRLLAYGAVFWLSVQYCRARERAEQLLVWISWSGFVFGAYGLINYFAGNRYLLWFERFASPGDVTATFVNRNHYATFAGLGLLCACAVGVTAFRAAWQYSDRSQPWLPRVIECLVGRPLTYFILMLVIGMAWLQTHSRMGAAAVLLGLLVLFLLMMATGLVRRRIGPWVIALLTVAFLFGVSGAATLDRWNQTSDINRLPIFSVVGDQIASAPFTGSGYGTFAQAFAIYRDGRLPAGNVFTQAHNSYLELAAELGLPAAGLLVLAVAWCVVLCLLGAFRRFRAQIYPIVAVAATAAVAAHAVLDFSLQIPAVAALYAALLGMGVAQSWSAETRARQPAPRGAGELRPLGRE